jgi:putative transposase
MINKAYSFRLYPTKEQATLIHKTLGCTRYVFNHFLAKWNETDQASEAWFGEVRQKP